MKRLQLYSMPMLLAVIAGTLTTISCGPAKVATLNVKIIIGQSQLKLLPSPCSDIKIVATPKDGQPIEQAASGPQSGATSGQCTASLKNVPAEVQIELKALYSDLIIKPDDTHAKPEGQWKNPLILTAGSIDTKYIKIDGKP